MRPTTIKSKSKLEFRVLLIIVFSSFQYIGFYYISQEVLPRFFLYIFYFIAFLLPLLLIFNGRTPSSPYRSFFIFTIVMMFVVSFIYLETEFGQTVASFAIYSQLLSALFFSRFDDDYLAKIFRIVSIIALLALPYILYIGKFDVDLATARKYGWTETFFWASLFWAVAPFVILSVLQEKNLLLSIAYWVGSIILNLFFLKRFVIVDSLILLFIILAINAFHFKKSLNTIKVFSILTIFIGGALFLKGDILLSLLNSTDDRISSTSQNIGEFDRFVESKNYLNNASIPEVLFGKGLTGMHKGLDKKAEALHTGWINFVLKGGVIFLMLIIIPYIKAIRMLRRIKFAPIKIQFSFWLLIFYSFNLIYSNMYSMLPEMLIFFNALLNIMDFSFRNQNTNIQAVI